jgi:hypothetical protein
MYSTQNNKDGVKNFQDERLSLKGAKKEKYNERKENKRGKTK